MTLLIFLLFILFVCVFVIDQCRKKKRTWWWGFPGKRFGMSGNVGAVKRKYPDTPVEKQNEDGSRGTGVMSNDVTRTAHTYRHFQQVNQVTGSPKNENPYAILRAELKLQDANKNVHQPDNRMS